MVNKKGQFVKGNIPWSAGKKCENISHSLIGNKNAIGERNASKRPEVKLKLSKNCSMKRPEVANKFKGDNNPMKRPEVRAKFMGKLNSQWVDGCCAKRHKAKHYRELGYNPINTKFPGSNGHHINKNDVLYIPEELHMSIQHKQGDVESMNKINQVSMDWYFEQHNTINRFNIEGDVQW